MNGQGHLDLGEANATLGDAPLVAHDLGWIPGELDSRLRRGRRPAVDPTLQVMEGGVDERHQRDLVHPLGHAQGSDTVAPETSTFSALTARRTVSMS